MSADKNALPAVVSNEPVDIMQMGAVVQQSGMFKDIRHASQAIVKLAAGQELGIGFMASLNGLHVMDGKVTLGANVIAGQVRRHPDYDFRVTEHSDDVCEIEFTYHGESAGVSRFTMDDAKQAGLIRSGGPWTKTPRNMLYARAMSNGARWFCPDVFMAPVYTPEELGALVDDQGEVIDVPVVEPHAGASDEAGVAADPPQSTVNRPPTDEQRARLAAAGNNLRAVDNDADAWMKQTSRDGWGKPISQLDTSEVESFITLIDAHIRELTGEEPAEDDAVDVEFEEVQDELPVTVDEDRVREETPEVTHRFRYDSESTEAKYTVSVYADGEYVCDCPAGTHGKACKHLEWARQEGTAPVGESSGEDRVSFPPTKDASTAAPKVHADLIALATQKGLDEADVMQSIVSVVGDDFDAIVDRDNRATIEGAIKIRAATKRGEKASAGKAGA